MKMLYFYREQGISMMIFRDALGDFFFYKSTWTRHNIYFLYIKHIHSY